MKKKRFVILLATSATTLGAHTAFAEEWVSYTATRFGAIADVPAGWRIEPPSVNNDGRGFRSPDGQAEIVISGAFRLHETLSAEFQSIKAQYGSMVTYDASGSSWIVVSGANDRSEIFYDKYITACRGTIINHISIVYPESEKSKYKPIVEHVSRSLRNAKSSDECGGR